MQMQQPKTRMNPKSDTLLTTNGELTHFISNNGHLSYIREVSISTHHFRQLLSNRELTNLTHPRLDRKHSPPALSIYPFRVPISSASPPTPLTVTIRAHTLQPSFSQAIIYGSRYDDDIWEGRPQGRYTTGTRDEEGYEDDMRSWDSVIEEDANSHEGGGTGTNLSCP